jgi:hypothetical protein
VNRLQRVSLGPIGLVSKASDVFGYECEGEEGRLQELGTQNSLAVA